MYYHKLFNEQSNKFTLNSTHNSHKFELFLVKDIKINIIINNKLPKCLAAIIILSISDFYFFYSVLVKWKLGKIRLKTQYFRLLNIIIMYNIQYGIIKDSIRGAELIPSTLH